MKNSNWVNFNANKWGKDAPDCAIRSLVMGIEIDYEAACKILNICCKPTVGYADDYGVDLDYLQLKFNSYLGDVEDDLGTAEDPLAAFMNAKPLSVWLSEHSHDNCKYLVYLDDNTRNDGGHIVYANCTNSARPYFVDTSDVSQMPVQAWIKIIKTIPKTSKLHYKYNLKTRKFI